ncbi:hypothetical protein GF406_01150 [candidate division KSB1 bacterium]|nr:hypothetical protein [candidate division KSB1 bacterium]
MFEKIPTLILNIFLLLIVSFSHAKDVCLSSADKFYEIGNYDLAITEYKRFIFFNPNDETASNIYYKIGLAFRNQAKWSEAIQSIGKSISLTTQDSIKDDRGISKAIIYISKSDFSSAEFELLRIANFSKYHSLRKKANFFLGVCYLYTAKWEDSRLSFNHCFTNSPSVRSKIDSLLEFSSNLKYKSPRLARWLSTFLPGSGQIYGGDTKNGINALILNSLTSYLLIDSLIENRLKDALIGNITLFERYYRGNRYNAEQIIKIYNMRISQNFAKNILDYLNKMEPLIL